MKAKEYLSQVRLLNIRIKQKQEEHDRLASSVVSLRATDYSEDRVQTSGKSEAGFTNLICKMEELESEINQLVNKLTEQRYKIIDEIHQLDDATFVEILYKRYVECKSLEVISVEMNYAYPYIRAMHGHALQAFEKNILHNLT